MNYPEFSLVSRVHNTPPEGMKGILSLAYKLLVNDKAKFSALLVGITFAVFLMIAMTSLFAGVLNRASATVINLGASVWVMDPAVQTVANTIGMPDYVLDATRSIKGVDYAVPVYSGGALVKLANGAYQAVSVVGLDDTSLFGRPQLIEGKIEDIYAENAFIVVKDTEFPKMGSPRVGADFELNDHRGVIVGIANVASSGLFGVPTLYTTYERALQYIPNPRFTISYVLVAPKTPADVPQIKKEVKALGYLALTKDEFMDKISAFYMFQTGLGMNLLIMTIMSFIVGLSISGQTFYTFVLENLEKFGALKAIGAKSHELIGMILFQASFTALTGYGLGVGLCALVIYIAKLRLPDYAAVITWWNLGIAFVMVIIIAAVSSYVGVRKVLRVEPFDIFRG
jgi:putative ABC transport system permease protein